MFQRTLLLITAIGMLCGSALYAESGATSFQLQAVRSQEIYGPFAFKPNANLLIESGLFKLNIISGHAFRLVSSDTGKIYGVYELIPGRMIDIGDVLFTIINIKTIASPANMSAAKTKAAPSLFDGVSLGLELELLDSINYKWKLNGVQEDSEEAMTRTSAALKFKKNFLTAKFGIITASDWDKTIAGDGTTYEKATLKEGTGWYAGMGLKIPIFQEGRWKGSIFGDASYHRETLSLKYGAWEVSSIVSTTVTNSGSNVVTTTTNLEYVNHDEDATLTETLVTLGADISYEAQRWFIYSGLKALPWADTSLDATIVSDSSRISIEFERKDPLMAYGGIGFILARTKYYLEAEGGGEIAVRLGLQREL